MITKHSLWVLMGLLPAGRGCTNGFYSLLSRAEKKSSQQAKSDKPAVSQAELINPFRDPYAESLSALEAFRKGTRNAVVLSAKNVSSEQTMTDLVTFRRGEGSFSSTQQAYAAAEGLVRAVLEVPGADETTFPVVWAGHLTERRVGGFGVNQKRGAPFWHRDRNGFLEWILMGESFDAEVDVDQQKLLSEFDSKFEHSVFVKAFASAMVAAMVVDDYRNAIMPIVNLPFSRSVSVANLLWKLEAPGSMVSCKRSRKRVMSYILAKSGCAANTRCYPAQCKIEVTVSVHLKLHAALPMTTLNMSTPISPSLPETPLDCSVPRPIRGPRGWKF